MEPKYVCALIAGLVMGLAINWMLKRVSKRGISNNRKRKKLISSQKNIAGRIKNALEQCLSENLQWGFRMKVDYNIQGICSTIVVFDLQSGPPAWVITQITVLCEPKGKFVRVTSTGHSKSQIFINDSNAPALTRLITSQLDLIRDWKPERVPV